MVGRGSSEKERERERERRREEDVGRTVFFFSETKERSGEAKRREELGDFFAFRRLFSFDDDGNDEKEAQKRRRWRG